jgi:hypothetical protein
VASRPQHELRISVPAAAEPGATAVFVDGRPVGAAPVSVRVSAGSHRIGAIAGSLRVPGVEVDVGSDGADVTLDVELAAAVDVNAGPALSLGSPGSEVALVKVGAWLEAERVLATSVTTEAGVSFLSGALYDVRRGALLREGRVRTAAGLAAPEHIAALSTFLLTGQPSAAVLAPRAAAAQAPGALDLSATATSRAPIRPAWLRRSAVGSAAAAVGAGAFAVHQLLAARGASRAADALVRADGTIVGDPAAYSRNRDAAASARRNAWVGAAGTAVFAAAAGALGYLSWERGEPVVRF